MQGPINVRLIQCVHSYIGYVTPDYLSVTSDALRQGKHLTWQKHTTVSHNRFILKKNSDIPNILCIKKEQKSEPKTENERLNLLKWMSKVGICCVCNKQFHSNLILFFVSPFFSPGFEMIVAANVIQVYIWNKNTPIPPLVSLLVYFLDSFVSQSLKNSSI